MLSDAVKLALFFDARRVASGLSSGGAAQRAAAKNIQSGQTMWDAVTSGGDTIGSIGSGLGHLADWAVRPFSSAVSKPFISGANALTSAAIRRPDLTLTYGVGLPLAAGAIYNTHLSDANRAEGAVMNARENPEQTLKLSAYLMQKQAAPLRGGGMGPFEGSILAGMGQGVVSMLGKALTGVAGAGYNAMVLEPRRKQMLESLMATDSVLSDAVRRNPSAKAMIIEAYATMSKFAPTLSVDVNAARSFLREAVLSGSGVSYAAIKNLIETEKALHNRGDRK